MERVGNKEVARCFFDERWNRKNLAICDELLAPSFDIEAHKAWVRSLHASFGDIQLDILALVAEGDQVAVHWRLVATHQGEYLGVAATGRWMIRLRDVVGMFMRHREVKNLAPDTLRLYRRRLLFWME
jgi:predicted ester cyclase